MRTVRPLIAGAAATAAALSMVGFAATAQAQPTVQRIHDPTVPLGVETAVNLPACPSGNTVTSVTPAPPGSVNTVINANKAKLAGDWLSTGSTTFTDDYDDRLTLSGFPTGTTAPFCSLGTTGTPRASMPGATSPRATAPALSAFGTGAAPRR